MQADRQLASWLVAHRRSIESAMNAQLGPAAPGAGSPESEALRRFRSFLCAGLTRAGAAARASGATADSSSASSSAPGRASGEVPTARGSRAAGANGARAAVSAPALDGLRLNERRVMALIQAWVAAAEYERGGANGERLDQLLAPWVTQFRDAIRSSGGGPERKRARVTRRAVSGAIDRVADAFLAIDTDTAEIVDANPAAGQLLGVRRDALLGVDALSFVPQASQAAWWTQLDAVTESDSAQSFAASLQDALGTSVDVDATMTRFATRGRVLALLMVRPTSQRGAPLPVLPAGRPAERPAVGRSTGPRAGPRG